MDTRPSISVDFDSTIIINSEDPSTSSYIEVKGTPTKGAKEVLNLLNKHFKIDIFSVRAKRPEIRKEIEKWLKSEGIPFDIISDEKLPSFLYIDNRALTFEGDWFKLLGKIVDFKSWEEKDKK